MPSGFVTPPGNPAHNLFGDADFAVQRAFFAARPHLEPTPLRSLPALAARLGIGSLLVKDETRRFGQSAFKAAGATFAVAVLRSRGDVRPGTTLVCASEGNHGRAVARAAGDAGCASCVYVAESVTAARVDAIEAEGASVVRVPGTYDDAVRVMIGEAISRGWTIVSDRSWDGYDEIPRLIMLGYTRLLDEAEDAWQGAAPDVMFVQGGVGGLLAAVACWADWRYGSRRPLIVGVEPTSAACLQASARHGRPTPVPGPFATDMGGLRCGEVSPLAFGAVLGLVDAYVGIEDASAEQAARLLAMPSGDDPRILAGLSGAAGLGGLLAVLENGGIADVSRRLGLGPQSGVLVIVTEAAADSPA